MEQCVLPISSLKEKENRSFKELALTKSLLMELSLFDTQGTLKRPFVASKDKLLTEGLLK